jgi:hypothetical protein
MLAPFLLSLKERRGKTFLKKGSSPAPPFQRLLSHQGETDFLPCPPIYPEFSRKALASLLGFCSAAGKAKTA